mmetsp:Transcript_39963/g.103446  ORF Transcript_39963/g.103446 Transcript_39963/m.103446 type:complete len:227 (-) Transcript_39963:983-1663(-)
MHAALRSPSGVHPVPRRQHDARQKGLCSWPPCRRRSPGVAPRSGKGPWAPRAAVAAAPRPAWQAGWRRASWAGWSNSRLPWTRCPMVWRRACSRSCWWTRVTPGSGCEPAGYPWPPGGELVEDPLGKTSAGQSLGGALRAPCGQGGSPPDNGTQRAAYSRRATGTLAPGRCSHTKASPAASEAPTSPPQPSSGSPRTCPGQSRTSPRPNARHPCSNQRRHSEADRC